MKKLIFLSVILFGLSANSQKDNPTLNVNVTTSKEKDYSDLRNEAATRNAVISNAMSESSIDVIQPIEINLNQFTHIALVGANAGRKWQFKVYFPALNNSPLSIINPYEYDKKRAKKDSKFLREEKNPTWLYLYYDITNVGVDEHQTVVVRDYENKIIYHSKSVNLSRTDIFSPLINF